MKLGHIEIFVPDPLASRRFYEEVLGCEVEDVQDDRFVWLRLADTEILLRPGSPRAAVSTYSEAPVGLVLYTADLEATRSELESRGLVFRGQDGSEECLTFTDPDGNWFQLVNPATR
jgi:catechol 2,3-dioxygenase-like lactoylglutathione lyase family enzyme